MLGEMIKTKRLDLELKLREVAAATSIDQTLLSRFEKGDRMPSKKQLEKLGEALKIDPDRMRIEWMADKLVHIVAYDQCAIEALKVAESRVEYLVSNKVLEQPKLSSDIRSKLNYLDSLATQWKNKQPLNNSQLLRLNEYFDVAYTFESNRIEGNTLSLNETALVINKGLTIGGKSMREHLEAINHADAIDFVRDIVNGKEDFSKRIVLEIHRLILKEVDNENAGRYRTVPVRISGSDLELPQPYMLEKMMEDYFEYYQVYKSRLHPVILAAEMHERLVSIHPFIDGNGRTARLVMNLILSKSGYTRANIKGSSAQRMEYYQALQSAQKDGNPHDFYMLVIQEAISSIEAHLDLT